LGKPEEAGRGETRVQLGEKAEMHCQRDIRKRVKVGVRGLKLEKTAGRQKNESDHRRAMGTLLADREAKWRGGKFRAALGSFRYGKNFMRIVFLTSEKKIRDEEKGISQPGRRPSSHAGISKRVRAWTRPRSLSERPLHTKHRQADGKREKLK